jgi:hypothetical protein
VDPESVFRTNQPVVRFSLVMGLRNFYCSLPEGQGIISQATVHSPSRSPQGFSGSSSEMTRDRRFLLGQWTLGITSLLVAGADLSLRRQSLGRNLKEVFPSSSMIDRYPSWA